MCEQGSSEGRRVRSRVVTRAIPAGGGGSCYAENCDEKSEGGVHRRSQKRFRRC